MKLLFPCFFLLALLRLNTVESRRHWKSKDKSRSEATIYRNSPEFKPTAQNITAGPGDRAVLKCRVDNLGTKTVTWRRKTESHPLTIGLFTFVGDTRISVDYNQRTNEWSLIIQDIRPGDEGEYQCQISTKGPERKQAYSIKLNVKTVQVTGSEYVERGSPVHLVCNASGKPDPPHDVEWYKDGDKINSDAESGILITKKIETRVLISVLVIRKSRMRHAGHYICKSSNRDSGAIKVHILNDPMRHRDQDGTSADKVIGSNNSVVYTSQKTITILTFTWTMFMLLWR